MIANSIIKFILWSNKTMSKNLADDLLWNFHFAKIIDLSQAWAPILASYLRVQDELQVPRINYVLEQYQGAGNDDSYSGPPREGALLTMLDKEIVSF